MQYQSMSLCVGGLACLHCFLDLRLRSECVICKSSPLGCRDELPRPGSRDMHSVKGKRWHERRIPLLPLPTNRGSCTVLFIYVFIKETIELYNSIQSFLQQDCFYWHIKNGTKERAYFNIGRLYKENSVTEWWESDNQWLQYILPCWKMVAEGSGSAQKKSRYCSTLTCWYG